MPNDEFPPPEYTPEGKRISGGTPGVDFPEPPPEPPPPEPPPGGESSGGEPPVIPPPPVALNFTSQMEYETSYAREHSFKPPRYSEELLQAYRRERGYEAPPGYRDTEPVVGTLRAIEQGKETTKVEPLKVVETSRAERAQRWVEAGILTQDDLDKIKADHPLLYRVISTTWIGSNDTDSINLAVGIFNRAVAAEQFESQQGLKSFEAKQGQEQVIEEKAIQTNPQIFQKKVEQKLKERPSLTYHEAVMATLSEEVTAHTKAYKEARATDLRSLGIDITASLFPPARALYPEVTIKDIRAIEWVEGGAQIALLALPVIGIGGKAIAVTRLATPIREAIGISGTARAMQYATIGGVGGVFTYDTIKQWPNMNNTERTMAVGMDLLILSPIIGRAASSYIKPLQREYWADVTQARNNKSWDRFWSKVEKEKIVQQEAVNDLHTGKVWKDITTALITKNTPLLVASGKSLQESGKILSLKGAPAAKQLVFKGEYLEGNASKLIKTAEVAKRAPIRDIKAIEEGLEANKQFIKNAERVLKQVKKPATREQIEKALKEAKKQVATQTKTKPMPLQEAEVLTGKYVPEVAKRRGITIKEKPVPKEKVSVSPKTREASRESVFPGIKAKPKEAKKGAEEEAIPREAWGRMTFAQIARLYGTNEDNIVKAFSKLRISERGEIFQEIDNSTQLNPKQKALEREKLAPFIKPQVRPQPQTKSRTQTKAQPKVLTETKVATKTKTMPKEKEKLKTRPAKIKHPFEEQPSDKQARQLLAERGGLAWPQGELNGQKVWHIVVKPYSQPTHKIVMGKKPEGAQLFPGPREAYKSIVQLYGKGPDRPTRLEGGAIDPIVSTVGGKTSIAFVKDRQYHRPPRTRITQSTLASDIVEERIGGHRRRHLKR